MSVAVEFEKKSVSFPRAVVADVQTRVGPGEFSAYVADAVARKLRQDALKDILAGMEAKHGPVDEAGVAAISARLAA